MFEVYSSSPFMKNISLQLDLERWIAQSDVAEAKTPLEMDQAIRSGLLNVYTNLSQRGGVRFLQELNVMDPDGSKAVSLDAALSNARKTREIRERLANVYFIELGKVKTVLQSVDAKRWVAEQTGEMQWADRRTIVQATDVDRVAAQIHCRNAVVDVLRPRISWDESERIKKEGPTSFELCRERYRSMPLRTPDLEEALDYIAQEPTAAEEWRAMFIELFMAFAIVEPPKEESDSDLDFGEEITPEKHEER